MQCVIYKATFPNNKVYIGKTKNYKSRIYKHNWDSKNRNKGNIIMSKSIIKYGFENIRWDIIHECSSIDEMSELEIFYIKEYNSTDHNCGYNMVCGDKQVYEKRDNIDPIYKLDIIKRKLKSNGHDPDKYIVIDEKLEQEIVTEYLNGGMMRRMSKKHGISRNRLKRLLLSKDIKIINKDTSMILDTTLIDKVISMYKDNKLIKDISEELDLTIMI